jgi:arylformamidase
MQSIGDGDPMNVTAISLCSHFGTHIDAPRHYFASGLAVDELPADLLIGRCRVVHYSADDHIPRHFVDSLDLQGVSRLFIRTSNSERLLDAEFHEDYLGLTLEAAQSLAARGIQLLGVDGYSIASFEPVNNMAVHKAFLGGGERQAAIEELNLSHAEEGDYDLIAAPIRTVGLDAAPARVFARARS